MITHAGKIEAPVAKKAILVVDDDRQIRQALGKTLRAEGYQVVLAADGQAGIDLLATLQVDLVLLDLSLPGKDGWDVFEQMSSQNPLLPVIVITGRQNQSFMAAAAAVGALIEKPLDVPFLLRTIPELLAEPPQARIARLAGRQTHLRISLSAAGGSANWTKPKFNQG